MSANRFTIVEDRTGDQRILRLGGELDLASAAEFEARLAELVASRSETVVDLSELSFMDSTGLALLIAASKQAEAGGGRLSVRAPAPPVRRMMELCGVVGLIDPGG